MAETKELDAKVWEAEAELVRVQTYHALTNTVPDAQRISALEKSIDDARVAVKAAISADRPEEPKATVPKRRAGTLMGAETTGLDATVKLRMDRLATSQAHLYALRGEPLVTVRIANKSMDKIRRVSVRCHIEGYSAEAISTHEIGKSAIVETDLFPPLFPDKIRGLRELTAASLHVEVNDLDSNNKIEFVMARPIPLLPPTTAVLGYTDPTTGEVKDQRELFAAYVTPNAPEIHDLLRKAIDGSKLKAMIGYQAMTSDEVRAQVQAIYVALAAAKIAYVDSRVAFGAGKADVIQRVRLPRESLASQSANCIDGTVLMASLLEATGLDPFIIIVPKHAFLGYRPRAGAPVNELEYIETTMISTHSFEEALAEGAKKSKAAQILPLDVRDLRSKGITPME